MQLVLELICYYTRSRSGTKKETDRKPGFPPRGHMGDRAVVQDPFSSS